MNEKYVERSVFLKFSFPASMPLDDQNSFLEEIQIIPCVGGDPAPNVPSEDDMLHDSRRITAYNERDYLKKGFRHPEKSVILTIKFPEWMPKDIVSQSSKRIISNAESIINEYISRRWIGTEE